MKKVLVTILAIIYLGTSTGATIHMHYCMGELADWSLSSSKGSKKCGKCGMEKVANEDNGCCKDEQKFLKNQSDQKFTGLNFETIQLIGLALPVSFIDSIDILASSIIEGNPVSHAPPQNTGPAIYIRNCVFRI